MKEMNFAGSFGEEKKKVRLTPVAPADSEYQLYIDGFYRGTFRKIEGIWAFHTSNPGDLTGDDIGVLIALINDDATPT